MTSTGDHTKENLDLLENKENSDDFYGELRMRIFILLRSNENFGDFTRLNENLHPVGEP